MKKAKKITKDYIITYRSSEHYEVLGWVRASSMREASAQARRELKAEIDRYGITHATIAEWSKAHRLIVKGQ